MASTDIETLLGQLSLEEKVFLLSGSDIWQTQEVSRLGIGSIKVFDIDFLMYTHANTNDPRQRMGPLVLAESSPLTGHLQPSFQVLFARQQHGAKLKCEIWVVCYVEKPRLKQRISCSPQQYAVPATL